MAKRKAAGGGVFGKPASGWTG